MDMILLSVNNPSANSMTFFRFTPENNNGVIGADAATTNAKNTHRPACLRYGDLKKFQLLKAVCPPLPI